MWKQFQLKAEKETVYWDQKKVSLAIKSSTVFGVTKIATFSMQKYQKGKVVFNIRWHGAVEIFDKQV